VRLEARYPTEKHEAAARCIVDHFSTVPGVDAVILMGSCARGKADVGSCVDILVLVQPDVRTVQGEELRSRWDRFYAEQRVFKELRRVGSFTHVDLEFVDGRFEPRPRGWTSGPDEFELEIGNTLTYAVPLWTGTDYFERLRAQWLPYYGEGLRSERLAMVRRYCLNNLEHVPLYVERRLHFQAFNRLYDAFREFLQALFIARRTYPIAYDKWIREQVEEILGLPELYRQLAGLLALGDFESHEIADKAEVLSCLLGQLVEP
jgi:predicted nucleotidyltransferase